MLGIGILHNFNLVRSHSNLQGVGGHLCNLGTILWFCGDALLKITLEVSKCQFLI